MFEYGEIFTDSLDRLTTSFYGEGLFFKRFYERFLGCSEEVRLQFVNTDMEIQKNLLRGSLEIMVNFSVTKTATSEFHYIAQRHSMEELNVAPHLYKFWLKSLLATIREFDPKYGPEVELAWQITLSVGITYMAYHYDKGVSFWKQGPKVD